MQLVESAGVTSCAQAATESESKALAREQPPALILSDIQLLEGKGPLAVQAIVAELGPIPVILVTGTPEACEPCDEPAVILGKPINPVEVIHHFRDLAPV